MLHLLKSDGVSIVNFQITENNFVISSRSQEVGSSVEEIIKYTFEGEPLNISFSGKFLSRSPYVQLMDQTSKSHLKVK